MLDEFGCTIHHFSHNSNASSTSQSSLLAQGQSLLLQVKGKASEWHPPQPQWLRKKHKKTVRFEYASRPPKIKGSRTSLLKDWGTPAEGIEIFRVAELTEFSSTEFFSATKISISRPRSPLPENVPAKKRKLNRESLYRLIPQVNWSFLRPCKCAKSNQPHFFPSPNRVSSKQTEFRPFKKTNPKFISPYLSFPAFLEWDRCTWIIPIYGRLPWPESTSAMLLDQTPGDPASPSPEANEIAWTAEAVLQLWAFLLDLRTAGKLGPLALSFQLASQGTTESTRSRTLLTDSHIQTHMSNPYPATSSLSISDVDHIRVYHDGPKCLGLRTVLDAWKFKNNGRGTRLLVGAKLVLLDEQSRGIMVL
ncbi:hypothetical protein AGABI2DRAFT_121227 [Agaricus bisporus var. bisporus H97]|uniref:hypothetical protein n=1 Tax=Agaricus bisporus var. bisporus (strain H97 / ATCC MYA-4626 / FGSC 10389) TaxID=936046 RepID=UPI00029F5EF7|nr:hypothetical protein AGABI2DRAFT_121227 [Agaricus bisporus var. bisporus H97]EKV44034.1 hypothetical protein AGABI2DRAFT_121227 [Agaricus bisporus var. bisporus H97]